MSTFRLLVGGSLFAWGSAIVLSSGPLALSAGPQKLTTNDGVYTKAQADGAKKQYDALCADCHPFTAAEKKQPRDVPLGDEPFFEQWTGRPLKELVTVIYLTMPNDGSAAVTEAEALDLVAYILQRNGYPAGSQPLTKDKATAVVERPKKK